MNIISKVIFGGHEYITNSDQVKGLFSKENSYSKKNVDIYFKNGKNFIDELFLELTTSDIMIQNIPIIFVRYYNFLFLGRYLVIQAVIITTQRLRAFQTLIILIIQLLFLTLVLYTHNKKGGLYENKFLTYYNVTQEVFIIVFLGTVLIKNVGYVDNSGDVGNFIFDLVATFCVLVCLLIELIGFLIMVFSFFVWSFKVFKKFCWAPCHKKKRGKKSEKEKKRFFKKKLLKTKKTRN